MTVRYCNAECQKNHWSTHKKDCKRRAAELHDEALFKDPPAKEDCPICFLPMPKYLISCISLPPATITSVPIYNFAIANEELASKDTEQYYTCCCKIICGGCLYSIEKSRNIGTCPFCKAESINKTDEETLEELMKRVEANDAGATCQLGHFYYQGDEGLQQDWAKAMELRTQAAKLGSSGAPCQLGNLHYERGDLKKAKFHCKAAAMAGHELARNNIGTMEFESGNMERAIKHMRIAASAGNLPVSDQYVFFQNGAQTAMFKFGAKCAQIKGILDIL